MYSNHFLKICEEAKCLGYPLAVEISKFVGRGFADLGYEVFSVLPGKKLLSLLSGEISDYSISDNNHLFSVPGVDEISEILEEQGVIIHKVRRVEQRSWSIAIKSSLEDKDEIIEVASESLQEAFMNLFIKYHSVCTQGKCKENEQ